VQVHIGMIQTPKELEIDLGDKADGETVLQDVNQALANQADMLWLTDRKGRRVGVATSKLAYVEIGPDSEERRVGFSAL
jgi:Tfp pilus assembly protein PilF